MTFIPQQQEKHCLVACSEDKVNAGLCDCLNRMKNEALRQPPVIKSVCDVCGSGDVIEVPHMGKNCNRCHPL